MKKICLLSLVIVMFAAFLSVAAAAEITDEWAEAPVITKAYEQSLEKLYIEWEGKAPVYQVYVDGNKVADTIVNHHVLDIKKGSHSILIYPFNEIKVDANTTVDLNVESSVINGGINIDLAALGLDPKHMVPGNPSEKLLIDYKPSQIRSGKPENISAYTDPQNRVVISFEDPYVSDEYLLTIARGSNTNLLTFHRNGEAEKELFSETGSMATLILDQKYLRDNECMVPEINEEYRFTVQFRKYAADYVSGEKETSIFSDSNVSANYTYRLVPIWKEAPVITFASQTADGQITIRWDHEDYDAGCEYAVMKINKVFGVMTGEDSLGLTSEHEYIVNDLNNGNYCINIVPMLGGEKGKYSADANVEIKNEWVVAPSLECEQISDTQVKLTWKAPGNIAKYHIDVSRGDNNSLLRFVDLDYSKYTEYDVDAIEGDMEFIFSYNEPVDSENGIKLKFDIYGIRNASAGGEQRSATSTKTIVLK